MGSEKLHININEGVIIILEALSTLSSNDISSAHDTAMIPNSKIYITVINRQGSQSPVLTNGIRDSLQSSTSDYLGLALMKIWITQSAVMHAWCCDYHVNKHIRGFSLCLCPVINHFRTAAWFSFSRAWTYQSLQLIMTD